MTKRNQEIDVDAGDNELVVVDIANENSEVSESVIFDYVDFHTALANEALQRLIDSGVIVAAEGAISWRQGHLEHVARVYAADQRLAWRDYADDLTVALSADGGTFAALVELARGE